MRRGDQLKVSILDGRNGPWGARVQINIIMFMHEEVLAMQLRTRLHFEYGEGGGEDGNELGLENDMPLARNSYPPCPYASATRRYSISARKYQ